MGVYKEPIILGLEWISQYSKDPEGGLTRLLFARDWLATQELLVQRMNQKGFSAFFDEVGNVHLRLEGDEKDTLLIGSHIDTVVQGGRLDGQFGVLAGLLAMERLYALYGKPKRSLEVLSMAEEEGSRFPFAFWGSKNVVGAVKKEDVEDLVDDKGIAFTTAMENAGFGFRRKTSLEPWYKAYLELHIEQGGVLEAKEKTVGIVHSIVGQRRIEVELQGEANHAGTTPMSMRKDTLVGASRMIVLLREMAVKHGEPMVATVGKIEIIPGTSNVIPGALRFSIDVRHCDNDVLEAFTLKMEENFRVIAKEEELEFSIHHYLDAKAAPMDPGLQKELESICIEKRISYLSMVSGAGHDAQNFAPLIPTALLFVPSIGGISHNPLEDTKLQDLEAGVEVLEEMMRRWAYEE